MKKKNIALIGLLVFSVGLSVLAKDESFDDKRVVAALREAVEGKEVANWRDKAAKVTQSGKQRAVNLAHVAKNTAQESWSDFKELFALYMRQTADYSYNKLCCIPSTLGRFAKTKIGFATLAVTASAFYSNTIDAQTVINLPSQTLRVTGNLLNATYHVASLMPSTLKGVKWVAGLPLAGPAAIGYGAWKVYNVSSVPVCVAGYVARKWRNGLYGREVVCQLEKDISYKLNLRTAEACLFFGNLKQKMKANRSGSGDFEIDISNVYGHRHILKALVIAKNGNRAWLKDGNGKRWDGPKVKDV